MYIYMYTYIRMKHIHLFVCVYICMCVSVYVCIYTYISLYVHIRAQEAIYRQFGVLLWEGEGTFLKIIAEENEGGILN